MANLQIDLQEGFDNDAVIIRVNGRIIYQKDSISTRMQIGFADSVKTEAAEGQTTIQITVPNRHIEAVFPVAIDRETRLGVSLDNEQIKQRVLPSDFGYA